MPECEYHDRVIKINGVEFRKLKNVTYAFNYYKVVDAIQAGQDELSWYRALILGGDLFFVLYFIMKVPECNKPFVVERCKEVMNGPNSLTLDVWAREHFKSTIITKAETICRLMKDSEQSIAILSYVRPVAKAFLRSIKSVFEESELLQNCFPDRLYKNPQNEAYKWSEDDGLFLKRTTHRGEGSLEAWGLTEGMPTSKHFDGRIYDDIVTFDLIKTPTMMQHVKEAFDMSHNLGRDNDWHRVIGTYYHHDDPLVYVGNKKRLDGTPLYLIRKHPATDDGTYSGASVLLSDERLDQLRTNRRQFAAQQLLDPTPSEDAALDFKRIEQVDPEDIPNNLIKFMAIDSAGIRKDRTGDCWGIIVAGLAPWRDDSGAADLYILDMCIEIMDHDKAMQTIVDMYCRNGRIRKIGVEKVGLTTTEIHISNALLAKGRVINVKNKSLVLLSPAGRKKDERIESNLVWPLNNGKIKISSAVPEGQRDKLRVEMERFPYWHDDGLDSLAYIYDLAKGYRLGARPTEEPEVEENGLWRNRDGVIPNLKNDWMIM